MEETYHGIVKTVNDALLVFEACRLGFLKKVERRLTERERHLVRSGAVFVWDEEQTGMRRWTDGRSWTASRINGNFLIYRELDGKRKSSTVSTAKANGPFSVSAEGGSVSSEEASTSLQSSSESSSNASEVSNTVVSNAARSASTSPTSSPALAGGAFKNMANLKKDGLIKLSFSVTVATGNRFHLVHYYSPADLTSGLFNTPSKDPVFAGITISRKYYPDTFDDLRTSDLKLHHRLSSSPNPREKILGKKLEIPQAPYSVRYIGSGLAISRDTMPPQRQQMRSGIQPVSFATSQMQTSNCLHLKTSKMDTKRESWPYQQSSYQTFGLLPGGDFSPAYSRRDCNTNTSSTFDTSNFRQDSVCPLSSNSSSNGSDTSTVVSPSPLPTPAPQYFSPFSVQPAPFQEVAWEKFPNTEVKRQLEAVYSLLSL